MRHDFTQWWKDWWEEDYSWDGLARKPWHGWCVLLSGEVVEDPSSWPEDHANHGPRPEGARPATLQDYWRDQEDDLICCLDGTKFTICHLPTILKNGWVIPQTEQQKMRQSCIIAIKINASAFTETNAFGYIIGPDRRVICDGCVLYNLSFASNPHCMPSEGEASFSISAVRSFFSGETSFDNAKLLGFSDFSWSVFSGMARFECTTFCGSLSFAYAVLDSPRFEHAIFRGDVNFNHVLFFTTTGELGANFDHAAFRCKSSFDCANFLNATLFRSASFFDSFSFKGVSVSGETRFDKATFLDSALFDYTVFRKDVWFESAAFNGDSWFDCATFLGNVVFNSAVFAGEAWFYKSAFAGNAWLVGTIFQEDANFSGLGVDLTNAELNSKVVGDGSVRIDGKLEETVAATPHVPGIVRRSVKKIDASGAIFFGEAIFDNRDIHEPSSFENTIFMRKASFQGSKLHQGVSFYNADFQPSLSPSTQSTPRVGKTHRAQVPNRVLFRLFNAELKNRTIRAEDEISLNAWLKLFNLKLQQRASLFVALPQSAGLEQSETCKDRYFENLEHRFRTLKRAMEENRNRSEERRFFKLELQARRFRRDKEVPWWERALSILYDISSDYGNSVVRPLVWLVGFVALFGVVYVAFDAVRQPNPYKWPSYVEGIEAASFALGRTLPFGPWADQPEVCTTMGRLLDVTPNSEQWANNPNCKTGLKNTYGPFTSFWVRVLASLQSFLALVLAFLSALAARRRFQIS